MKKTFVLDENVIRAAGAGSTRAVVLLTRIVKNYHHIATNSSLLGSYTRGLRTKKNLASPELPKLLGQLTHHAEKCYFVPEATPDSSRVPLRHQKDVFLVRIAEGVGSASTYIVSMDKETRDDINAKTGLRALTVAQALDYAQRVDD